MTFQVKPVSSAFTWYCLFGLYRVVLTLLSVGKTLDSMFLSVGDILVYLTFMKAIEQDFHSFTLIR